MLWGRPQRLRKHFRRLLIPRVIEQRADTRGACPCCVSCCFGNVAAMVAPTVAGNVMNQSGGDADREWVTLGEFARRLGITRGSVYGRIRRGTVESRRKGNKGFEVRCPPPDNHNGAGNGDGNYHGNVGSVDAHDVAEMRVEIARLEERLAGVERTHKAEVLAREVVIADLRMALAEARRPFWQRWLG